MLYTKQLISGRDINMKEHLLGVIRQPIVDDFMDEYEFQDFLEVFYLEQTYNVEGLFGDMNKPFTYFLAIAYQEPKVLNSLNRALCLLYDINPKILYDEKFAKTHEKLVLKNGIVDGQGLNEEAIKKLSSLPNKEGMLAKFASCLNAPVVKFAMTIKALAEAKENGTVKVEEAPQVAEEAPAQEAAE